MPRLTDTFLAEPGLEHADRATHQSGDDLAIQIDRAIHTAAHANGAGDHAANPAKNLVELRGIEPLTLRLPA
jgi:hypothetical protein